MKLINTLLNSIGAPVANYNVISQELGRSAPMGPNAHRSRSISDVSSFSTVSVLCSNSTRVRVLCAEETQIGCISSHIGLSLILTTTAKPRVRCGRDDVCLGS